MSRIENYHEMIIQKGTSILRNDQLDFYNCVNPQILAKIEMAQDGNIYITPSAKSKDKITIHHFYRSSSGNEISALEPNKTYQLWRGNSILFFKDGIEFTPNFLKEFPATKYHIYAKLI